MTPPQLLPKSAEAFAPRVPPTIVLGDTVAKWLTQTLKRVNKVKRPLNSVVQHFRCLTDILGGPEATWLLASLMLPKAPDSELQKDANPLLEAISNYDIMHIEAYIVHVDMVSQHEVAFKLTTKTIDALIEYHKDIYCVDVSANTYAWPEKDSQIKRMQEEFVQAVNRFIFRTDEDALEGLEEDGAGELLRGRSAAVKRAVMGLFLPLLPPPPRIVDVVHPAPVYVPMAPVDGQWWSTLHMAPPPMTVDSWRILPSTPSPTTTSCSEPPSRGGSWSMGMDAYQLPSPTPSFSQPTFTTSAPLFTSPQAVAAVPALHYPSAIQHSCGSSMGMDVYGWSYNAFATPQYATI